MEKADETTLHNKIENIISELLKNDNYKMLTDHSKEEIEELYKNFPTLHFLIIQCGQVLSSN